MTDRKTEEVLRNAQDTLEMARLALGQMRESFPSAQATGLRNFLTWARSVTFVLQTLRNAEPEFDAWYAPWAERLRANALAKRFVEMRNQVEKEGVLATDASVVINGNMRDVQEAMERHRPPNAIGYFIGDRQGRSGWEVVVDGRIENFYCVAPDEAGVVVSLLLPDADGEFAGVPIAELAACHLTFLEELVGDARRAFR